MATACLPSKPYQASWWPPNTDLKPARATVPQVAGTHFAHLVRLMSERKAIVLVPEDDAFTPQAAANYLGVSRQHLVDLPKANEIRYHRVGIPPTGQAETLVAASSRRRARWTRKAASPKPTAAIWTFVDTSGTAVQVPIKTPSDTGPAKTFPDAGELIVASGK